MLLLTTFGLSCLLYIVVRIYRGHSQTRLFAALYFGPWIVVFGLALIPWSY